VIFIDEAHLVFKDASKVLLEQIETVIKLIRSKGVGVFFITQNPTDVPASILSQLGMKIQHALRAFTAKDRTDIKKAAENFPISDYYKANELLTEMGIGEAFITLLDEKGRPTPLVHTLMRAPNSRMDILTDAEIAGIIGISKISAKYNKEIDSESAYELLNEKLAEAGGEEEVEKKSGKEEKGTLEKILTSSTTRQIGRTAASILTRTLLGALGLGGTTRRRKKTSWF
jgi:DNA helicase HerA-like ATPase